MDETTMIYQGSERTVRANQSPLQLYKGQESVIKERAIQDGALYFATDSKKIYLDCDFTDSLGTTINDRLAFGGSSGIFYSSKEFDELTTSFTFDFSEIEGVIDTSIGKATNVPKSDDIIIDTANGSFFRIDRVYEEDEYVTTVRLTVAGSGGGGGGSGVVASFSASLMSRTVVATVDADTMPIRYKAYSPEGYQIDMEVYREKVKDPLFVLYDIPVGNSKDDEVTYDLKGIIQQQLANGNFIKDTANNLVVRFTDGVNTTSSASFKITILDIQLIPQQEAFTAPFSMDANYGVTPYFPILNELTNQIIHYTVKDYDTGIVYQSTEDNAFSDGVIRNLTTGNASFFTVNYVAGGRKVVVESWMTAVYNNVTIRSNTVSQNLAFDDPDNPTILISVIKPLAKTEYAAYEELSILYSVSYGAVMQTLNGQLRIYKYNETTKTMALYKSTDTEFTLGRQLEWKLIFTEEGIYSLEIIAGSGAGKKSETFNNTRYTIAGSSSTMPVVVAGAQFNFVPDKNESSINKDHWETTWYNPDKAQGSNTAIGNVTVQAELTGFNWNTNGWFAENASQNKLVLNNGAKLTIPIAPFYGKFTSTSYDGAISTGKTIEFDVKISNVRDRTKTLIDWSSYFENQLEQGTEPNIGIIATGDYFVLTGTTMGNVLTTMKENGIVGDAVNGLIAHYSADERVHICYVIAAADIDVDGHTPKNYIYTYVNGILSGIVARAASMNFLQPRTAINRLVVDSTYADIDIYNLRFYGSALSPNAVLENYLAGIGDLAEAERRKKLNSITDYDNINKYSYVSLAKIKASGQIPYLVLRGGYRCDKKASEMKQDIATAEVSLPYFNKKDYRYMEAYFVDPNDIDRCFGIDTSTVTYNDEGKITNFANPTSADRWKVTIYPQGTSSLEYPVKNLRMNTQKKKYALFDNIPEGKVFTFKADYMDSSMAHNTGTANQLNSLYASAGIKLDPVKALENTNHEYADKQLLTAILGKPCIIFYYAIGIVPGSEFTGEENLDNYTYIGRYNFNLDKSESDLFGFFSDEDLKYGYTLDASNNFVPGYEALVAIPKAADYDSSITYYKYLYRDGAYTMVAWQPENYTEFANYLATAPLYIYKDKVNSIQCWEMKNNNNDLTCFRASWDDKTDFPQQPTKYNNYNEVEKQSGNYSVWLAAYESRYPDYDNQQMTDKRAFSAFLNWLESTNLYHTLNDSEYTDLVTNHGWDILIQQRAEQEQLAVNAFLQDYNNPNYLAFKAEMQDTTTNYAPYPLYDPDTQVSFDKVAYITYVKNNMSEYSLHSSAYLDALIGVLGSNTEYTRINNLIRNYSIAYFNSIKPFPENGITINNTTYMRDSQDYRLAKFRNEFNDHMKLDFTTFYYIITELEVLMDSRAKNMMMVSYDANNETGEGHWYPIFYDMDSAMGVNNTGKLVYRYDVQDTTFGIYNATADYPRNPLTGQIDHHYGGEYSVLWANFRMVYANGLTSPVANMYRTLRTGQLNISFLLSTYNNTLANAWCETLINQDEWYKFIRAKDEPNYEYNSDGDHVLTTPEHQNDAIYQLPQYSSYWKIKDTSYADFLYAAQGTRSEHRKQWLKRRMAVLDGKYAITGGFKWSSRVNPIFPANEMNNGTYTFNFTADDTSYIHINLSANSILEDRGKAVDMYIPEGKTESLTVTAIDNSLPSQEQEGIILYAQNIVDMGALGLLGFGNIVITTENSLFKLRSLDLSLTKEQQYIRDNRQEANQFTSFNTVPMPLLEHINVDNQYSKFTQLNVSTSKYLKTFSARNSNLQSIEFSEGGIIEEVYVPNTLTSLVLKNQSSLRTVDCDIYRIKSKPEIGSTLSTYVYTDDPNETYIYNNDVLVDGPKWKNLNYLVITNPSSELDTKTIFKKAYKPNGFSINLEGITWTLDPTDPEECTLDGNMIVDLPILNKLLLTLGAPNAGPPYKTTGTYAQQLAEVTGFDNFDTSKIDKCYYMKGTVIIDNGQNYGLDVNLLKQKYEACYPELILQYTQNSYTQDSVSVYLANGRSEVKYRHYYPLNSLSTLTANQLFESVNMKEFAVEDAAGSVFQLVGFKTILDTETDNVFVENNDQSYEQALAAAINSCDIKANIVWTELNQTSNALYDDSITYYTTKSLSKLDNSDYIWTPSLEAITAADKQTEFQQYLANDSLYIYNTPTFTFVNGFTVSEYDFENHANVLTLYPVFVNAVREFTVKFYDDIQANNPKVIAVQHVRFTENAESMNNKGIVKIVIDESNYLETQIYEANYPEIKNVVEDQSVYPTFDYTQGKTMRDTPTNQNYFDVEIKTIKINDIGLTYNGPVLTIKEDYPYEAITIPAYCTVSGSTDPVPVMGIDCAKKRTKLSIQMEIKELEREQTKNHTYTETEYNQLHLALEVEKQNTTDLRFIFVENKESDPNNIRLIMHNAFMYQGNLKYFDFPHLTHLDAIGNTIQAGLSYAFAVPKFAIEDITKPEASTTYSHIEGAFYCCTELINDELPPALILLGAGCFANCPKLHITRMPKTLQIIGSCAFASDIGITGIYMGFKNAINEDDTHITAIQAGAFANCTNMYPLDTNLQYRSLTVLAEAAFAGCENWKMWHVPATPDNNINDNLRTIGKNAFLGCKRLNLQALPGGLSTIEANAFQGAYASNTINILSSITTINSNAFRGMTFAQGVQISFNLDLKNNYNYSKDIFQETLTPGIELIATTENVSSPPYNKVINVYEDTSLKLWQALATNPTSKYPTNLDGSSAIPMSLTYVKNGVSSGYSSDASYTTWFNRYTPPGG